MQNQASGWECAYRCPHSSAIHYTKEATMHSEATVTRPQQTRPGKDLK